MIKQVAVSIRKSDMPEDLANDLKLCKLDAKFGPVYLDSEGKRRTQFCDNVTRFDFESACVRIREWLDENVKPLKDPVTGSPIGDSVEAIKHRVLGKELYRHVYPKN